MDDFDIDKKALEQGGLTFLLAAPSAYTRSAMVMAVVAVAVSDTPGLLIVGDWGRFAVQDTVLGFLKDEKEQLEALAMVVMCFGVLVILLSAMGFKAPYGRHNIGSHWIWGLKLNGRLAWIIQVHDYAFLSFLYPFLPLLGFAHSHTDHLILQNHRQAGEHCLRTPYAAKQNVFLVLSIEVEH
eukprot:1631599-Rhodomonas_salina.2